MSGLSGYDGEVVGFDSISSNNNPKASSSSQTTEFSETGTGTQTKSTRSFGCMTQNEHVEAEVPEGLNEFLRKVVPEIMDQLDENNKDFSNSSDSDEEELVSAKLLQEISLERDGSGDHDASILAVTWSSAGNSFAVSIGKMFHETWCQDSGRIKVYTLKSSEDRFILFMDITEKNCVTALKYHLSVAALLAYGTTSGEVVVCDLTKDGADGTQLTSPSGCHGALRVSCLQWADTYLANAFLTMMIKIKKKRRGASDHVLITSGSNGTINIWQVNTNNRIFENIICYNINSSQKSQPDITCFDFVKKRSNDDENIFVVGTNIGKMYLCKMAEDVDPVYEVLDGHGTCVLDVVFNAQRREVFVSLSIDSELRVYDINQACTLKVVHLDMTVSSMCWLTSSALVLGLAGDLVQLYDMARGEVAVDGLRGRGDVTCVASDRRGFRIAAGEKNGAVRVWELPSRVLKTSDVWM